MGVRGVEVSVREDGSRMASNTNTCSIDTSLRDTSIAHGFMVGTNQERLRIPHEVRQVTGGAKVEYGARRVHLSHFMRYSGVPDSC